MNAALEQQLRRLLRNGFAGMQLFGKNGQLEALNLSRISNGMRETVRVYSETEALVYRAYDGWDPQHPFYVEPGAIAWLRYGEPVGITNQLLLPPPAEGGPE